MCLALVKLTDAGNASIGCPSNGCLRFKNADSDVGKRHFSTFLAAFTSGNEVKVETVDCSQDYPNIDTVWIRK